MTIRDLIDSLLDQLESGNGFVIFQDENGIDYKGILDITLEEGITIIHLNDKEETDEVEFKETEDDNVDFPPSTPAE